MIVLDTNVVSALMRVLPDKALLDWVDDQPSSSLWTTSITVMEIRFGLEILPAGRRREAMTESFEAMLESKIEGRVASFDSAAARCAAELMALRRVKGRPVELNDTMIAGIVVSTRATLATRNTSEFEDLSLPVVNPWKD